MKLKSDDLLRLLKILFRKELSPINARLTALEAENAVLRGELAALRSSKSEDMTPAQMSVRYAALQ